MSNHCTCCCEWVPFQFSAGITLIIIIINHIIINPMIWVLKYQMDSHLLGCTSNGSSRDIQFCRLGCLTFHLHCYADCYFWHFKCSWDYFKFLFLKSSWVFELTSLILLSWASWKEIEKASEFLLPEHLQDYWGL